MLLIGKPSISMGHLYHGYVSHNQRVGISVPVFSGIPSEMVGWPHLRHHVWPCHMWVAKLPEAFREHPSCHPSHSVAAPAARQRRNLSVLVQRKWGRPMVWHIYIFIYCIYVYIHNILHVYSFHIGSKYLLWKYDRGMIWSVESLLRKYASGSIYLIVYRFIACLDG